MLDILIRGGTVIDGSGAPRRQADVGIEGGAIVAVGDLRPRRAPHASTPAA
jgi:N-acyl-D-amino-acid deacylase